MEKGTEGPRCGLTRQEVAEDRWSPHQFWLYSNSQNRWKFQVYIIKASQLSVINAKMPTLIVGIVTFMSRINSMLS